MSTHANLTGTDLHEPKGIGSAAVNTVYVANGSGSGVWEKLPSAALDPTSNAFGAALLHVREEQANNVNGTSTGSASAWSSATLNTVKTNEITGASLAGNLISLPAGTYWLEAIASCVGVGPGTIVSIKYKYKLRGTSGDILIGLNNRTLNTGAENLTGTISGRFTLGSADANIQLMSWNDWGFTNGGWAINASTVEVYSDIKIWKIA